VSGEIVIVDDEIVTVVAVGVQGPPGPGLASTDRLAEGRDQPVRTTLH
jgi:hypothetical protein